MHLKWTDDAWEEYLFRQQTDKRTCARINRLIKAMMRNPFDGEGKPEPLSYQLAGTWSRRIDKANRIVYSYDEKTDTLCITQCRFHYDDK